MSRTTVLLAEDHPGNAALLRELLQGDFDLVGEVADGRTLVSEASQLTPDVIVADISMPGLDGIEAARRILARNAGTRVVLVTAHADAALVKKGLAAGALGYVVKRTAGEELLPTIHAVLRGESRVRGVPGVGDDGTAQPPRAGA